MLVQVCLWYFTVRSSNNKAPCPWHTVAAQEWGLLLSWGKEHNCKWNTHKPTLMYGHIHIWYVYKYVYIYIHISILCGCVWTYVLMPYVLMPYVHSIQTFIIMYIYIYIYELYIINHTNNPYIQFSMHFSMQRQVVHRCISRRLWESRTVWKSKIHRWADQD